MFSIWIGNRVPHNINLNLLDIQYYLSNGSCAIEPTYNSDEIPSEVSRLFKKYGGTLLRFDPIEGMILQQYKTHGTSNHEEISGSYLAGGIEYLDRTVARVRYKTPETNEAFCSRVLMADCTFMITYGFAISRSTVRSMSTLRKEMINYLANNQVVKFIPPQPVLKQAEVQQEYIRESSPTIITVPSALSQPTHQSGVIDLGDLVSAGIAIGASTFIG